MGVAVTLTAYWQKDKNMKVEHIISFTRTPQENADDQMVLSAALATAIGTVENVSSTFVDGQPFDILWEHGLIKIDAGASILQLTQAEALSQAASLRQAALNAGATVDCS